LFEGRVTAQHGVMTKKHDEKVAADERADELETHKEQEKQLKKAEGKISTLSKVQAVAHALEPKP